MTSTPAATPKTAAADSTEQGYLLYLGTLAIELVGAVLRYFLVKGLFWIIAVIGWIVLSISAFVNDFAALSQDNPDGNSGLGLLAGLLFTGNSFFSAVQSMAEPVALFVAGATIVISLLTLILPNFPGGGLVTYYALGARRLSRREWERVSAAMQQVKAAVPNATLPLTVYALDERLPRTFSIGTTLYITHSAILRGNDTSPNLLPLIAHALGHHSSIDARLTLALRRLVLPTTYYLQRGAGTVAPGVARFGAALGWAGCVFGGLAGLLAIMLALAGGGFGVLVLAPLWQGFWRLRDYKADQFAARAGLGEAMITFLQTRPSFDVPVPFMGPAEPYAELRIDRLLPGGEVVAQNEQKENQNRTRLILLWVAAPLVLLAMWIGTQGVYNTVAYNIDGTQWRLAAQCFGKDCGQDPMNMATIAGYDVLFVFAGNRFIVTQQMDNRYDNLGEGSYTYSSNDTIFMDSVGTSSQYAMRGFYKIRKDRDELTLEGDGGTFILRPISAATEQQSVPEMRAATAAASGQPATVALELVGVWEQTERTFNLEMYGNGDFQARGANGGVDVMGTFVMIEQNGRPAISFTYTYPDTRTEEVFYTLGDRVFTVESGLMQGTYNKR